MAEADGHGGQLDSIDVRLLRELVDDGRMSMRALAEKVNISRAHAYVRVERLMKSGVIEGFAARLSYEKAGFGVSAFVALSIQQATWRVVAEQLRHLPAVDHFSFLGGDFDVIVLVRAVNNAALRDVVLEQLQNLDGVLSTKTWLIFEEANGPGPNWH